jgi:hypothetical protein
MINSDKLIQLYHTCFPESSHEKFIPRIVQKPQATENRAKKVANRPLLIPRMVFENGELWEFN